MANPAVADHLLPQHGLKCSADFPCPPEIRRRVDFWIQVFKGWNKEKAILHDPNRPERVYMVIDTGKGCSRSVSRRIKANQKVVSNALNSLATNLSKGRKITNKRERHLLTLFPSGKPKEIINASKKIRCQSGVKDSFVKGLKRFNQYAGMVDRVLLENDLPPEIRYLPFVESSYNPAAYSKAGAAGLWQIMPATARSLGLELNATVDERLDPEAATRAAAKYFRNATTRLTKVSREKDPNISSADINPFVITSYNYGVNGMRRAINKIGPEYMQVLNRYKSPSFQVAVKNFYASFLAAKHVASNEQQYFGSIVGDSPVKYQTLVLQNATSIDRVKKVFKLEEANLKPLNKPLTRFIWNGWRLIPAGYRLRLPPQEDKWAAEITQFNSLKPEKAVPGGDAYVVRRGDTACGVARALRVNCSELIKANGLGRSALIRIGQKLVIPRKVASGTEALASASQASSSSQTRPDKIWTVKRGDTACGIAKRTDVSCRELIRANQLGRSAKIVVGQKLIVPGGGFPAASAAELNADNRYIVQKGDAACVIAARFSVSCREFIRINNLNKRATIYPGQKLKVPGYEAPATSQTAAQLASAQPSASEIGKAATVKRDPGPSVSGNQLVNLLDTLPDLSIRVGSEGGNPIYYVFVEVDETLGHFADWLGIGGSGTLRKTNRLKSSTSLRLGQRIVLPQISPQTVARFEQMRLEYHQVLSETLKENFELVGIDNYTIKKGESLWYMSQQFGFPLWLIYRLNPKLRINPGLSAGQIIKLPQLKSI
ncbi:MAG: LysM peptidoglycan-binding domain-containing protein [bacterium]